MHIPENFEIILATVRRALERFKGQSKSGAHIHTIISDSAPELDIRSIVGMPTGPGALTKFIETYLSETVKRIGNKGGDILYIIGTDVEALPNEDASKIWKAFVSPNAVNHFCLDNSRMRLAAVETSSLNNEYVEIGRVTDEEHDAIRQSFVETLEEDQQVLIESQYSVDPGYDGFVQILRANRLMKPWGIFRREAFERLLEKRLEEMSLDEENIPVLVNQLSTSQRALFKQKEIEAERNTGSKFTNANNDAELRGKDDLDSVRRFARQIIDHMAYDDIRTMTVPLGAIIDALTVRK